MARRRAAAARSRQVCVSWARTAAGDTNPGPPARPRRAASTWPRTGRDLSAWDRDITAAECDISAWDRDITAADRDLSACDQHRAARDCDLNAADWARAVCARLVKRVTGGRGSVFPAMGPPLPRLGPCGARAPSLCPALLDRARMWCACWMRTTGTPLLAAARCSLAWMWISAQGGRCVHGLLSLAAVRDDWRGYQPRWERRTAAGSGRCIGVIIVGGALMPVIPRLDRSADLRWSPAEGLLHAALSAGDPQYVHDQGFSRAVVDHRILRGRHLRGPRP